MKIEVKLYSYHDMDLVSLYKTGRMSFPEATKQILKAYANGEAFRLKLNPECKNMVGAYHKFYRYYVELNEKQDADAIKLLQDITYGCRTNFVKTLLRQYIGCQIPSSYSASGDSSYFATMSQLFEKDLEKREIRHAIKKSSPGKKQISKNTMESRPSLPHEVKKQRTFGTAQKPYEDVDGKAAIPKKKEAPVSKTTEKTTGKTNIDAINKETVHVLKKTEMTRYSEKNPVDTDGNTEADSVDSLLTNMMEEY